MNNYQTQMKITVVCFTFYLLLYHEIQKLNESFYERHFVVAVGRVVSALGVFTN